MDDSSRTNKSKLLAAWFGSAAVTIFLPLFIFTIGRLTNSSQDENDGNNNQNDNNGEDEWSTPWWYFGGGKGERRDEEATPPILIATYLWSVLVFSGVLFYGFHILRDSLKDLSGIIVALVLFANYCVLSMFLFSGVEGAIETEGRGVEEHGFVGQFGVMMYLTSACWLIFSVIFACIFRHKARHENVEKVEVDNADYYMHDGVKGATV